MASLRLLIRPATRASIRFTTASRQALRPLSASSRLRAIIDEKGPIDTPSKGELGVGEIQGASFRVEPLRRVGEDDKTMRARLVYQSRKRGTLESDLLLSTFAAEKLPQMTRAQMEEYDRFLDENDWDIYYWATQETPADAGAASETPISAAAKAAAEVQDSSSADYAGGAEAAMALDSATADSTSTAADAAIESSSEDVATDSAGTSTNVSTGPAYSSAGRVPTSTAELFTPEDDAAGKNAAAAAMAAAEEPYRKPGEGEWAQTVGTFKPAYRPVPARWRDSEVLKLLREHVKGRSAGGDGQGGGMGFMPSLDSKGA